MALSRTVNRARHTGRAPSNSTGPPRPATADPPAPAALEPGRTPRLEGAAGADFGAKRLGDRVGPAGDHPGVIEQIPGGDEPIRLRQRGDIAMRCREALSCRLPLRDKRCRCLFDDHTGNGAVPSSRAKASLERNRRTWAVSPTILAAERSAADDGQQGGRPVHSSRRHHHC